jgi:gliding motility-associated-like protein
MTGVESSHIFEKGGIYIIRFSALTSGLCPITAFDTIHVNPQPIADFIFTPEYASMENPLIQFNDQSIYPGQWSWNFGDDASGDANFSAAMNPWHIYSDTGYYPIELVVMNGSCSDTILKWLYIHEDDLIFIPNAFSPNGDGKNDVFRPEIIGIDETAYELYIYDRWGKLVFLTKKTTEGWDGRINGKFSEPGIFVYTVKYKEVNGIEKRVKGAFTLVR